MMRQHLQKWKSENHSTAIRQPSIIVKGLAPIKKKIIIN